MNTTTKTKTTRAVIYARVSADDVSRGAATREEMQEQASISIRSQVEAAESLAAKQGLTLVAAPLVDDGISGFKGRERAGFTRLVAMVNAGEVDEIITRHVDRVGRNDADNSAIRIATASAGVIWRLTNGTTYDPSKSGDALSLTMLQGIAVFESAVKSERLRSVNERRRLDGKLRASNKCFGWKFERNRPEVSMLAEPVERAAIQDAYAAILRGDSLYSIVRAWNADPAICVVGRVSPKTGKRATRWTYQSVRSVLLRPSNAGLIRNGQGAWLEGTGDDGGPLRGKWEPMTDVDTFKAVRRILTDPARTTNKGRRSTHLASGIATCGVCGGVLHSSSIGAKGAATGTRVPIYRCENKISLGTDPGVRHVSARLLELDAAVRSAVVDAFAFGPRNLFPRASELTAEYTAALAGLDDNARARARLLALTRDDDLGVTMADIRADLRRLKESDARHNALISEAAERERDAALMPDLRALQGRAWFTTGDGSHHASFEGVGAYKAELGRRFDALTIDERRRWIRKLLTVNVAPMAPGRVGKARWEITHLVVTDLNEPETSGE